jgi:hypothetical protein
MKGACLHSPGRREQRRADESIHSKATVPVRPLPRTQWVVAHGSVHSHTGGLGEHRCRE